MHEGTVVREIMNIVSEAAYENDISKLEKDLENLLK